MQRIVGGELGGRRLRALPAGLPVRPTGARVREAIFSRIQYEVADAVVLDLFAGTGAMAIEALSRGARSATLVEQHPRVARFLREQLAGLGLRGPRARVVERDARAFVGGRAPAGEAPTIVFIDPPYADAATLLGDLLPALAQPGRLADGALVVVETARRGPRVQAPPGLTVEKVKAYGQTTVEFLREAESRG